MEGAFIAPFSLPRRHDDSNGNAVTRDFHEHACR